MGFVVQDAELSGCHTVDGSIGMNEPDAIRLWLDRSPVILGRVSNLESDRRGKFYAWSKQMKVADGKVLLVSGFRVVAMRHIERVGLHILLDDEPRPPSQSKSLTLSDGVKPQASMLADVPSCL